MDRSAGARDRGGAGRYSYVTLMLQPSSLPLGIRSVEWLRANDGAWLVNDVERVYYSWHAPRPGGPALKRAADRRLGRGRPARSGATTAPSAPAAARITPVVRPALAGEGVWRPAGAGPRARRPCW